MLELPSRDGLKALTGAVCAVVPATAVGFARRAGGDRVSVLYSYEHGLGEFELGDSDVLGVLLPAGEQTGYADAAALRDRRTRAVEAFLLDNGAGGVVSVPLPGVEPPARLWVGLSTPGPLSAEQMRRLELLAADGARVVAVLPSSDEQLRRLTRLEQAAELIPALLHVLDVRQVIDRLSETARRALPHDLLFLNLFSDDLSTLTVYARSDQEAGLGMVRPNPYPASTIEAWTFNIVDDHTRHPMEREALATKIGARSSLRFPVRFDNRVIGGVSFISFQPGAFTDVDVPVGRRLADHVASAISHFKLAERLAAEAAQAEELQAQTTSLELLDAMLGALSDVGTLPEVIDRVSLMTRKVLPHDAMAMPVIMPDGVRARFYATNMPDGAKFPDMVDVPDHLRGSAWDFDVVDDLQSHPEQRRLTVASLGYRSALRLPIRVDGETVAGVGFFSFTPGFYTRRHIPIGRRIADRLAISLLRERGLDATRRADEADARVSRLEARVRALTDELDERTGYRRVIGESASWRQVLTQATQVAATDTTALLLGESGTGKEVVARFIHRGSPRSRGPFIALNCAALPEQLLEAELFGYERGAFTGATQSKPGQLEQAAGGTLFLDEVGEMSLPAQAKFLRVLQEREFQRLGGTRVLKTDARIVAATNRDLQKAIDAGQFREDLFYRLNVFAIRLPPLRDRKDDILPLTQAFLTEFGRAFANPPAGISREAREMLLAHHWPGNIRELRNTLERAAILCDGGLITDDHLALPPVVRGASAAAPAPASEADAAVAVAAPAGAMPGDLQSVERAMIEQALQDARFNKSKAAKALGLTRHQLYIRMRRHGLEE